MQIRENKEAIDAARKDVANGLYKIDVLKNYARLKKKVLKDTCKYGLMFSGISVGILSFLWLVSVPLDIFLICLSACVFYTIFSCGSYYYSASSEYREIINANTLEELESKQAMDNARMHKITELEKRLQACVAALSDDNSKLDKLISLFGSKIKEIEEYLATQDDVSLDRRSEDLKQFNLVLSK